ncbi:MAG: hypothetical protein QMD85_05090 [Candidatus Aenigmarchaeota archaeon]|nr:hypothetical protein [Candidatus Aenigmarchaeota archaeon]
MNPVERIDAVGGVYEKWQEDDIAYKMRLYRRVTGISEMAIYPESMRRKAEETIVRIELEASTNPELKERIDDYKFRRNVASIDVDMPQAEIAVVEPK